MTNKFEVKAVIIKGIDIGGYIVAAEDDNTKTQEVNTSDIIKLAKTQKIVNAETVLDADTGEHVLSIDEGLINLERVKNTKGTKINILCRIVDESNKCTGYKVTDNSGKTYRLSNKKVWELAVNNFIDSVEAVVINNKKIIRSKGDFKLEDLPRVNA